MAARALFVAVLLLLALATPRAEARHVLDKYPHFRCSACRVVAEVLHDTKKTLTDREKNPIQVSHRLGDGKWDHHGAGGVKKVDYATSEIMAIEVVDEACTKGKYTDYKVRVDEDKSRLFTKDDSKPKAEAYNDYEKLIVDEPAAMLVQQCQDLAHEHEDALHDFLRTKDKESEFSKICLGGIDGVMYCKNEAKHRQKEAKLYQEHKKKELAKVNKVRAKGETSAWSMSEIEFYEDHELVSFVENGAQVRSESGHKFPAHTAPEKLIDGQTGTRMTDREKGAVWVSFNATVTLNGFSWMTSDDAAENDPVRWVIQVLKHSGNDSVMFEQDLPEDLEYPQEWATDDSDTPAYPLKAKKRPVAEPAADANATEDAAAVAAGEKKEDPTAAVAEGDAADAAATPPYRWVTIDSWLQPFDVPVERKERVGPFPFPAEVTARHIRLRPLFGIPHNERKPKAPKKKKVKKEKKPAASEKKGDNAGSKDEL